MIEIDKRSDVSAYIKVGNITIYVEPHQSMCIYGGIEM